MSETAGTTRDVIEVHLDLGGWPVVLADTAGLRESGDAIEQEGVRRAQGARRRRPTCACWCSMPWRDWKSEMQALTEAVERWDPAHDIVVVNKVDLAPAEGAGVVPLSAMSGDRPARRCWRAWRRSAAALMEEGAGAPPLTRARHREALLECQDSLGRALAAPEIALAAEDLTAGAARAGPHHRHGADRRAAGRHLPRLLHREVTIGVGPSGPF